MEEKNYLDRPGREKMGIVKTESYATIWNNHDAKIAEIERKYKRDIAILSLVFFIIFSLIFCFVMFSGYF